MDGRALALALREGVDTAYKAVMKPAKGTILTVSGRIRPAAVEACQADSALSAEQVLCAVLERGREALAWKPYTRTPCWKRRGVVDAGAFGFLDHPGGMLDRLRGVRKERAAAQPAAKAAADFAAIADEEITFTYCTEFIAARARTRPATSAACARS